VIDAVSSVRDRLLAVSAVTAIVGSKVTTGRFPQSTDYPAVLVRRVSRVKRSHLRGGEGMQMTRVQVTLVAATRAAMVALEAAVEGDNAGSGLDHFSGSVGSPSVLLRWVEPASDREDFEAAELNRYRVDKDYFVHHR
jgi:hypothetical protein